MSGLLIKNLSKSFGDLKVIDDVSLELSQGELLVILGPSGCGKSTCLRLIAGLEEADSGEIYLGGRRLDHLPPKDRDVAMVFQNYSLYPHMSVAANLAFPLKVAGEKKSEIEKKVTHTASILGLTEKLKQKPGQLSGGQRQRVALGRAIIRKPSLFLLDEPLSNLDADLRVKMRREIVQIQKKLECTTVYVTHDQSEALTMADRIALLDKGRIVQIGTPKELYSDPVNLFTARFIGQPGINIIKTTIREKMQTPLGRPVPSLGSFNSDSEISQLLAGVRPEQIQIHSGGEYTAEIKSCEYAGESYLIGLDFFNNSLAVTGVKSPFAVGDKVKFSLPTDLLYFDPDSGQRLK